MKKFLHNFRSLIYCIIEIAIGILILINHITFTNIIVRALGAVFIVIGVLSIMKYFRLSAEMGAMSMGLSKGLIQILFGTFCVFNPEWFTTTFTLLSVAYGIGILFVGLIKLQWAVDSLRLRDGSWMFSLLGGLASVIFGLVIAFNPLTPAVVWIFVGITLIVIGVLDGFGAFMGGAKANKEADEENSDDVEITDIQ